MNNNAKCLEHLYKELQAKLKKPGAREKATVQIVNAHAVIPMSADNDGTIEFDWRKTNTAYVEQEKEWYLSHELKIDRVSNVKIWQSCADRNGEINSNYGNLVYSRNNFSQFDNALESLKKDKNSRQAMIIYTRPSIHYEWNSFGAHEFICTNFNHFIIDDNKLEMIVSMRSNDAIFGTMNDVPWFTHVYQDMYSKLKETYPELEYGNMHLNLDSFHVYARHYDLLENI